MDISLLAFYSLPIIQSRGLILGRAVSLRKLYIFINGSFRYRFVPRFPNVCSGIRFGWRFDKIIVSGPFIVISDYYIFLEHWTTAATHAPIGIYA